MIGGIKNNIPILASKFNALKSFTQIEILHTESGKPYINRTQYLNEILREHFANKIDISISHCKEYAAAVVLIE